MLTAQTPLNKQFENYGFPAIVHRPYPIESRKNCILDYHHQQSFYLSTILYLDNVIQALSLLHDDNKGSDSFIV